MANHTQEQIDIIIQQIMDAEDPCTVTNQMVATVLLFLMDAAKEQPNLTASIMGLSDTLNTLLSGNANEAIESFNEVIAFLAEVTDEQTLTGLLLSLHNEITDKASKAGDGRLNPQEAPVVMLDSMGSILDSVGSTTTVMHIVAQGDYIFSAGAIKYYKTYYGTGGPGNEVVILGPPQQGLVYCNKKTGLQYRWTGSDTGWVQVGGGRVINDLTTGGTIDALSAEQGKVLKAMIEGLDVNSDTRIGVVDTPSDTVLAAPSARMVKEIYLNLQALYTNLAGIAFLGTKPTWQTVDTPEHTITLGTMTNVSASLGGTAINGSTSAEEGEVTILLTPSSNNYMGSISIKDASNHDVEFTQADVAGGTEITFILYGNVTISASASSGIQVNVSGDGITSYTTGVQPNTAAQLNIALPEHHTWGTVTVSYGGTDITSQCTISQANNVDKVITLPSNLSDMSKVISIVANAVEDAHVTLTISGSNFVVKQGNTQLSNDSKVYNGSTAQTITIEPASGCKFSTLPSADKGTMTNNGPYEASSLEIGTSVSGTLTITAEGATLGTFNIDLYGLVGVSSSNTATSILEGSPYSTTLSKTDPTASGSVIVGTCTMGSETITADANNSIIISHVTGHITLAATVGVLQTKVHSWGYASETDENNKHYLPDGKGDFWLYNQSDASLNTGHVPAGYYGNSRQGISGTGIGYGAHRTLPDGQGGDFTLKIKGLEIVRRADSSAYVNAYLNSQQKIKLHQGGNVQYAQGQFSLVLTNQNPSGTTATSFCIGLSYGNNNSLGTGYFDDVMTEVSDNSGNRHDYLFTFDADTLKATCYRVTIDPNGINAPTLDKCGEVTVLTPLVYSLIAYAPSETTNKGLDIYNYAMSQSDIEAEYRITNNE